MGRLLIYLTRVPTLLSMAPYICILLQTGVLCLSHMYSILNLYTILRILMPYPVLIFYGNNGGSYLYTASVDRPRAIGTCVYWYLCPYPRAGFIPDHLSSSTTCVSPINQLSLSKVGEKFYITRSPSIII